MQFSSVIIECPGDSAWFTEMNSCCTRCVRCCCRHLLILTPLLSTANSGPATLPLLSTWALSAAASSYIAIKPSEE